MIPRETIQELLRVISKQSVSPGPAESLFDAGVLDSFSLVDLIGGLEQAFGIKIPDTDLNPRQFDSIERIEQYLQSRL